MHTHEMFPASAMAPRLPFASSDVAQDVSRFRLDDDDDDDDDEDDDDVDDDEDEDFDDDEEGEDEEDDPEEWSVSSR